MLGAFLGFEASRPDQESGAGPDVLWVEPKHKQAISFELKTGKEVGSELSKKEVGQSHNHIQWMADNNEGISLVRHFVVGRELAVSRFGNPDHTWCFSEPHEVISLMTVFVSEADKLRKVRPESRGSAVQALVQARAWNMASISDRLCSRLVSS